MGDFFDSVWDELDPYEDDRFVVGGLFTVKRESAKAILVTDESGGEYWVPKGQIHPDSEVYKAGTSGILIVTRWIAKQKGWSE